MFTEGNFHFSETSNVYSYETRMPQIIDFSLRNSSALYLCILKSKKT